MGSILTSPSGSNRRVEETLTARLWADKVAAAGDGTNVAMKLGWAQDAETNKFISLWRAAVPFAREYYGGVMGARLVVTVDSLASPNAKPNIVLTGIVPASFEDLAAGDYDAVENTPLASEIAFNSLVVDDDIIFELDATGVNYLNAQFLGYSAVAFAIRTKNDVDNSAPTWSAKSTSDTSVIFSNPRLYLDYEDGNFFMI